MRASVTSRSIPRSDRPRAAEAPRLSRPASLLLILALSVGLWTMIWAATASVVSAIAAG